MGILSIICPCCCGPDDVDVETIPKKSVVVAKPKASAEPTASDTCKLVKAESEVGVPPPKEEDSTKIDSIPETADVPAPPKGAKAAAKQTPLKACRLKPHARKLTITGAVAVVPSYPKEKCEGPVPKVSESAMAKLPLGDGIYLVYSLKGSGSLDLQFSKTKLKSLYGVLAYIKPKKEIAHYHYTRDEGCINAVQNVQNIMQSEFQSDRKNYYNAWLEFLRWITSTRGSLYLLEASKMHPPPETTIVLYRQGQITKAEANVEYNVEEYEIVGILPGALDYLELGDKIKERTAFVKLCKEHGAVLCL